LEEELLEYETVGEFLTNIRKKFRGGDKELVKVAELKKTRAKRKDNRRVCTGVQKSS